MSDSHPVTLGDAEPPESATGRITLESLVAEFVQKVERLFPDRLARRPKPLKKRLLRLIDVGLPPFRRPPGRPKSDRITRAAEIFVAQRNRGTIDWQLIAQECSPGYAHIKSEYRRRVVLDRLRNAVYARLERTKRGAG